MSILATSNEVTYTWSGQLPPRHYKNPTYSTKVFLGGVPWDITESMYDLVTIMGLVNTYFFVSWWSSFVDKNND